MNDKNTLRIYWDIILFSWLRFDRFDLFEWITGVMVAFIFSSSVAVKVQSLLACINSHL